MPGPHLSGIIIQRVHSTKDSKRGEFRGLVDHLRPVPPRVEESVSDGVIIVQAATNAHAHMQVPAAGGVHMGMPANVRTPKP